MKPVDILFDPLGDGKSSVELLDVFGDDLMPVNTARVSNGKWHDDFIIPDDVKLLRYLAKHGHKSPFYHPQIQLRVMLPIFVIRQLARHHVGIQFNEVSRRYVDDEPLFYEPIWRARPDKSIKQGSGGVLDDVAQSSINYWLTEVSGLEQNYKYDTLINEYNVAPEQARTQLDQSMYTEIIITGNYYAWVNLIKERTVPTAQWEIRQYAQAFFKILLELFPHSTKAFFYFPADDISFQISLLRARLISAPTHERENASDLLRRAEALLNDAQKILDNDPAPEDWYML